MKNLIILFFLLCSLSAQAQYTTPALVEYLVPTKGGYWINLEYGDSARRIVLNP